MSTPPRDKDLSHYVASLPPRTERDDGPMVGDTAPIIAIERPSELMAAAVGALIVERLAQQGGSLVPLKVARDLRERLTGPLSAPEVMSLEVEAYRALSWFVQLEDQPAPPPPPAPRKREGDDRVRYDPLMTHIDLVRRAIAEEFDLDMIYYTQSRGQVTRRNVTPLHLEAETYLHAYCHSRREERVFRMSRIGDLKPVDGVEVNPPKKKGQGTLEF